MKVSPPLADGRAVLALLALLAVGSATGLAGGLITTTRSQDESGRALSPPEARQLAAVRATNFREARAGVFATLGATGAETYLTGWVDWRRSLVYGAVSGPGAAHAQRLLQAIPGVVAERPHGSGGRPPTTDTGRPPANPPTDGWQLRASAAGNADHPLDSLVALLLSLSRGAPDASDPLLHSDARWLGRAQAAGTQVDVMVGPAAFPTAGPRAPSGDGGLLSSMGGAVRYFVDDRSRLHRFDVLLPGGQPVRVDIDRGDRTQIIGLDAFGGRPTQPRPLTAAEATLVGGIRSRNADAGGARITMVLPAPPVAHLTAQGWVNWAQPVVYVAVRPTDRPADALLLRADPGGVAATPLPAALEAGPGPPPIPPPRDRAWTYRPWGERSRGTDLDLLVSEVLWLARADREDVAGLRAAATWLRYDRLAGARVTVFEVARPGDRGSGVRDSRLRYWVDARKDIRRLEVRTSVGTFAHVDLDIGNAPGIAAVPTT